MKEFAKASEMVDGGMDVQGVFKLLSALIDGFDLETCEEWVNEYDKDYNGIIDISEFIQLMLDKLILINHSEVSFISNCSGKLRKVDTISQYQLKRKWYCCLLESLAC